MSAALDTLTAEEQAQFKEMEAADADLAHEEPAPTPRAEPAEPAEPAAREPDAKLVDKRALDAERTRRKQIDKDFAEFRVKAAEEQARVTTRLEMLAAAVEANVKAAPAAETPPPAFDADPKGYIEHKFRELDRRQAEFDRRAAAVETNATQTAKQQETAAAQNAMVADLESWAMQQEAEYAQQSSDYQAAMTHLATARAAQLRAIGVDNPGEIQQIIRDDVRGLAHIARQRGKQLGEVLYNMSKAAGYKAASAAPPASTQSTVESAAERLLRGQDMATTVGSTGGAPRGDAGPAAIAAMNDAEWKVAYEKILKNPAQMRQLFGN